MHLKKGHYLTLSASLNLDMDLAAFKLRDRIRRAIRELIKNNLLRDGSGFKKENTDVVKLLRFPHKKKLRRLN